MNLMQISKLDEAGARAFLESLRWPEGPRCAHCGDAAVTRLKGKAGALGQFKCRNKACMKKFTATNGTIFHRSHIALRTWLMAFAIVSNAKKGISARQLHRALGIGSFTCAWHMCHRIRHVLRGERLARLLTGSVEVDEVYVGAHKPGESQYGTGEKPKTPVLTLVERNGELRAMPVDHVTAINLTEILEANVDRSARLLTDEAAYYKRPGKLFASHETVRHCLYEFARPDGAGVNTAESFHSLLRRGMHGSFHHVSRRHLHRYVDEFMWRWNHRKQTDAERTVAALRLVEGRRLTYKGTKTG